jgi:hypothetical protein
MHAIPFTVNMSVSAGICQYQQTNAVISFPLFGNNNAHTIACSNVNTIHILLIAIRNWNSLLFRLFRGSENYNQEDIYSCYVLNTHLYIRPRRLPQHLI